MEAIKIFFLMLGPYSIQNTDSCLEQSLRTLGASDDRNVQNDVGSQRCRGAGRCTAAHGGAQRRCKEVVRGGARRWCMQVRRGAPRAEVFLFTFDFSICFVDNTSGSSKKIHVYHDT